MPDVDMDIQSVLEAATPAHPNNPTFSRAGQHAELFALTARNIYSVMWFLFSWLEAQKRRIEGLKNRLNMTIA